MRKKTPLRDRTPRPDVSVIAPARNEADRLHTMLGAYLPALQRRFSDAFELLVVVNGSTDETFSVARKIARAWPQMRVMEETESIGKGGAIIRGLREAHGQRIGFVDADGSTPPSAFLDLYDKMENTDAIIASRYQRGAHISPQPKIRRVASRAFNLLVRLLFGLPFSDTQCGAKLFTDRAIDVIMPRLGITQWAFDVDLLFQLRRAGFEIREIPTEWNDVSGSHLNIPRASIEMLLAIMRLRLLYSPFRRMVFFYDHTIGPGIERWTKRN